MIPFVLIQSRSDRVVDTTSGGAFLCGCAADAPQKGVGIYGIYGEMHGRCGRTVQRKNARMQEIVSPRWHTVRD